MASLRCLQRDIAHERAVAFPDHRRNFVAPVALERLDFWERAEGWPCEAATHWQAASRAKWKDCYFGHHDVWYTRRRWRALTSINTRPFIGLSARRFHQRRLQTRRRCAQSSGP